jgi:O-antigen ligase/Flp pilus assembly protein TadD
MKQQPLELGVLGLVAVLPTLSYPLSWLPASAGQFRYTVVFPWIALMLAVGLLLAARTLWRRRPVNWPRAVAWPVLVLLASWLLSVRFSSHPHFSLAALPVWGGNLAVFGLALGLARTHLRVVCWVWLGAACLVALNGLARLGTEPLFVSTIGNRNFLAAYLAASVAIGVGLNNWRAWLAVVVLLAAMIPCGSRGAWLALIVTGLGLLIAVTRHRRWMAVAGVAIAVAGGFLARHYVARQWQTDVRPAIWASTGQMIADRPLVGHGLGTFWVEYVNYRTPDYFLRPKAANLTDHAHNELLEIAAEQGVLGLSAMLWLGVVVVRTGLRSARRAEANQWLYLGLFGAVAVFVLHGLVDVDLRYPPNQTLLWLLFGLLAAGDESPPLRGALRSPLLRWAAGISGLLAACWVLYAAVIQPVRADFWERRARLAEARGDLAGAVFAAQESLRLQPLRVGTRYFLAGVLARQTPTRVQAIAECLRIEAIAPDYGDITFNLGQLYLVEGQPASARPYLERAVAINPHNADKRVTLAQALAQLGRLEAAQEQARAALRLHPDHPEARQLLATRPPPAFAPAKNP